MFESLHSAEMIQWMKAKGLKNQMVRKVYITHSEGDKLSDRFSHI